MNDATTVPPSASSDGRAAYFVDQQPEVADFRDAVIAGLSQSPKQIPAKFFYDEEGSHIFNRICETEEYYVTRTEIGILEDRAADIRQLAGPGAVVIEYGCGSATKINLLLQALEEPAEYAAIDISKEHLQLVVDDIAGQYPDLRVGGICADFSGAFELPPEVAAAGGSKLGFFPGSTIGNQTPEDAVTFLTGVRRQVGDGGALLIGVDLRKDVDILNRAYNDAAGHTAAFNKNLLIRMARELGSDVDPASFDHYAYFNDSESRIEMHLRSVGAQSVRIGEHVFSFEDGETIHTENSYKYSLDRFAGMAADAGFEVASAWTDAEDLFSVQFLKAA